MRSQRHEVDVGNMVIKPATTTIRAAVTHRVSVTDQYVNHPAGSGKKCKKGGHHKKCKKH
ncbi:hypothetical protein ACFVYE_43455 [Streptomyces sp. NPDC058239]|uniref:hypothetical protein n=1 Tax=Streptomyces sp. NPDC058239 TaxID=3346395 RepID=UPI0036EE2A2E